VDAALSAENGVIILPCGVGKTAVALSIMVKSGAMRTVIMTISTRAAYQLQEELLQHTDVDDHSVWVVAADDGTASEAWKSGVARKRTDFSANEKRFVLILPYTLFSSNSERSSAATQNLRSEVLKAKLDLLILDEAHTAAAKGKRELFRDLLVRNTNPIKRRYGLTATPYREASVGAAPSKDEDSSVDFSFLGPILYHSRIADAQADGLIARMNHHHVSCSLPDDWKSYLELVPSATVTNDVIAIPPEKIETAARIVRLHLHEGRRTIIFVEKLLAARLLLDSGFFPYFAVVSGENPAVENDSILRVFAAGDDGAEVADHVPSEIRERHGLDGGLNGIITTRSGDTATNFTNPSISVGVKLDHQGCSRRAALQRDGRLCRTADCWPHQAAMEADKATFLAQHGSMSGFEKKWTQYESLENGRARRIASQKQTFIYNLVTENTREEAAATHVETLMVDEGYRIADRVGLDQSTPDGLTILKVKSEELCQHIISTLRSKGDEIVYELDSQARTELLDRLAGRHLLARVKKKVQFGVNELRRKQSANDHAVKNEIKRMSSKLMKARKKKAFEQAREKRKRQYAVEVRELRESIIRNEMIGASKAAIAEVLENESF
jgi:hypothetical protein